MKIAENTRTVLLCAALVFCAALAAHAPALSDSLLWDDAALLAPGSFAATCGSLPAAVNPANLIKVLPVAMSARPVVNISLIADACSGAGARGLRLTNLLLHSFNGVLLFFLVLTLSGSIFPALAGALLFAVHPAAAEAVNIAVFRSHLLGFFFFTCALLAAIYYARKPMISLALAASACALLGMLSVETAVVLPAAALAAVYFDSGPPGMKRFLRLLAALLLAAAFYAWFRAPRSGYEIEGVSKPGMQTPSRLYPPALLSGGRPEKHRSISITPWRRVYADRKTNLYTMSAVAAGYAADMVFPLNLNTDYNPKVITSARNAALPLLFALGLPALGAWLLYKRRLSGLGIVLAVIAVAPALNLFPIYNLKADRYLYLPLAGAAIVAAALLRGLPGRKAAGTAAAVVCIGALGALTILRAPSFRDDLSFFSEAVRRAPGIPRARANLSAALLRAGDCGGAAAEAAQASCLDTGNPQMRLRLAYTLAACGRAPEALPVALQALQASPGSADALYLAGLLRLKKDRGAGQALLEKALAANPSHREARLTLAMLDKKIAGELSPGERTELTALAAFYREAGLFF